MEKGEYGKAIGLRLVGIVAKGEILPRVIELAELKQNYKKKQEEYKKLVKMSMKAKC